MDLPTSGHDPVLLRETLDALNLAPGKVIIDGTLGRAGHGLAIAERIGPGGLLIGLDVDPRNLEYAQERLKDAPCRVRLFHANFAEIGDVLDAAELKGVDGILVDLGISTNQLFDAHYGLSFAQPMPLDMRVDPRIERTAADIVNRTDEETLANLLFNLADERFSRRVARKIGEARRQSPIMTTDRLADVVRSAIPRPGRRPGQSFRGGAPQKIDPATRTFMALRMAVNRELENLQFLLDAAPKALVQGGRFAVISFHSTEDRVVKQAFRSAEQTGVLDLPTPKPVSPSEDELAKNPRARSAKLRVAQKA